MISNNSTYVIAEIGINHGGSLHKAKKLIAAAKASNSNAVKFQTYITEKRVKKESPIFNILKNSELSYDDHRELVKYSKIKKIDFITTPFDIESFNFIYNELKLRTIKISSFDTTNFKFLKHIANFKITVILSLGMASLSQVKKCVSFFSKKKARLVILHCISGYPILENEANLSNIRYLINKYPKLNVGYSDHTNDIKTSLLAVAAGAKIIEKHFMLTNDKKCIDYPVSIDKIKMTKMIKRIREIEKIFNTPNFSEKKVEKNTLQFRRYSK